MDVREISTKLSKLFELEDNVDSFSHEGAMLDDLIDDSLVFVEMIMLIEEEFGIEIPDDESNNFKTVADVINYISSIYAEKEVCETVIEAYDKGFRDALKTLASFERGGKHYCYLDGRKISLRELLAHRKDQVRYDVPTTIIERSE